MKEILGERHFVKKVKNAIKELKNGNDNPNKVTKRGGERTS